VRIAFFFDRTWDWNDSYLEYPGLGGTETCLVHLSRHLARKHQVTIFNPTSNPGTYTGVTYRNASSFCYQEEFDVLITMSYLPRLRESAARVKVHWSLEDSETWVRNWGEVLRGVDAVVAISPFHARWLAEQFHVPSDRITVIPCGVQPEEYLRPVPKTPGKLIYCSVPDRGLVHLLPIYGLARERLPGLQLVITSDFSLWGREPGNEEYRRLFSGLPGVHFLGKVPRSELVWHQKSSQLHVYPCTVNELCCLASLECQAAGTPTVTTGLGALTTTVLHGQTGLIIPNHPHYDPQAYGVFARAIVGLLANPGRLAAMADKGRERARREFGYPVLAGRWVNLFREIGARKGHVLH